MCYQNSLDSLLIFNGSFHYLPRHLGAERLSSTAGANLNSLSDSRCLLANVRQLHTSSLTRSTSS